MNEELSVYFSIIQFIVLVNIVGSQFLMIRSLNGVCLGEDEVRGEMLLDFCSYIYFDIF